MNLYFDLETIPSQREDIREKIAATITPPGNYKKEETIAQWEAEKKPQLVDEALRKTALNGTFGEIISIAWAFDDETTACVYRKLGEDEGNVIIPFISHVHSAMQHSHGPIRWVGHYITGFDLRFLWQRCVINKIKPTFRIPYDAKPWADNVFDTKIEWTGLSNYSGEGSLDSICLAMGYQGKGDMDGSKVWDYVQAGRYSEIASYNQEDVEKVRKMHKAMVFAG